MPTTIWGLLGHLVLYGQRMLVYPHGFIEQPQEVYEPSAFDIPFQDLRLNTSDGVTIACHLMLFEEFYKEFAQYKASAPQQDRKKRKRKRSEVKLMPGSSKDKGESSSAIELVEEKRTDARPAGPQGRATVVMFHGNAMNHGDLIDLAVQFLIMGCNVLTVSYRGYGNSTGKPSEGGLRIDSQTVLDHLTAHPTLSHIPIIVYGQSLGGAVAIDLVSRNCPSSSKSRPTSIFSTSSRTRAEAPTSLDPKVAALILENTFLSIPQLVRGWPQPLSSLSFLCTQRWPSQSRIRKVDPRVRMLMLSGENDAVVPRGHMAGLWAAARTRLPVAPTREEQAIPDSDKEAGCSTSILCGLGGKNRGDEESEAASGSETGGKKSIKTGLERRVLTEMNALQAPVTVRSGAGDVFRLFEGTGHDDTYLADTYWDDVRAFIDSLGLEPPVEDPEFHEVFTNGMFGSETIFARR